MEHRGQPLYKRIKEELLEEIRTGALAAGQALPSERDLCRSCQTSRMTVRQAVNELELEGHIYRVQGKGSFVARAKMEQPLISVTGFSDDMRRRGKTPGSRVLCLETQPADKNLASQLGILLGEPVLALYRLRLADGIPMALEHSYLNYALCSELLEYNLEDVSLYHILENDLQLKLKRGRQYMEAALMTAKQARLLEVPANALALSIERHTYTENGIPLEVVYSVYRGDLFRFYIELGEAKP